ncbi:MAG: hypothetical protein WC404_02680 [Candidatus Omnitrophota bacterium]
MSRKSALCAIIFVSMALIYNNAYAEPKKLIYPIDISGKILDKDGRPFTEQVELKISVSIDSLDYSKPDYQMQSSETEAYTIPAQGGTFSWNGEGSSLSVEAVKEGYHSTKVDTFEWGEGADRAIKYNDTLIYLIPKGTSSKLEFTRGAEIPSKKNDKSGGKQCGWSFSKRWYYPVDGDISVDITRGVNENKYCAYTMKEPGGFIYFEGYPTFESNQEGVYPYAAFDLMPEAPETGYISTFVPAEHEPSFRGSSYFCYFKTPDGKYGKICFEGSFSYYLQPDGSRNLEAGEVVDKGPRNPIEAEWLDKEIGEDN